MSVSAGVVAYADETDGAVKSKLAAVKGRIEIPEEFSEFTYSVNTRAAADIYSFNWETERGSDSYGYINASICGSVLMSYEIYRSDYTRWSETAKLAAMTKPELYSAAVRAVKKLNPTVADSISVDKESIRMSVYGNTASFSLTRTANNIPVANDTGSITLDKNTGELISFNISWHPGAAFEKADKAISADKAWDSYEKMIALKPQYEIFYNSESEQWESRLVYVQTDYGDINAFTGNKSNFQEDAFFGDDVTNEAAADAENPATGGMDDAIFTEKELKELGVELPYGTEKAVVELIKGNKYLTYSDGMKMEYSYLSKDKRYDNTDRYMFTASFSSTVPEDYWEDPIMPLEDVDIAVEYTPAYVSRYESMSITVDAQTGEVLSYGYYTDTQDADSYDMTKADKLAKEIANDLASSHISEYTDYRSSNSEYTDYNGKTHYNGSYHSFNREVNDITVDGNYINISLDPQMKLTRYSISYSDVKFADPKGSLTSAQAFEKFKADNEITLCYKARMGEKKTATVLVYSCDRSVYCDAFTGEPIYSWWYSSNNSENDLSGIKDKKLLKIATTLDDNGVVISAEKFSENSAVKLEDFVRFAGIISRVYRMSGELTLPSGIKLGADTAADTSVMSKPITRGDAMVIYTAAVCGNKVAELKGIYRSPFDDVKDSDKYVGYYAIAGALGAADGKTLDPDASYTYADMIELMYDSMK